MRVTFKFVFMMVLILVGVRSFEGILTVQRETARLDATIHRGAQLLRRVLTASIRSAWLTDGRDRAMDLIDTMNVPEHPIHIRWAPLGGEDGLENRLDRDALGNLERGQMVALREQKGDEGEIQCFFMPVGQRRGKVEPALWGSRRIDPPIVSRCVPISVGSQMHLRP